jgi:hypothetical protein
MEQPQLVVDAIRQVVEAVRSRSHQVRHNKKTPGYRQSPGSSHVALGKAREERGTKSGLPEAIVGL